MGGTFIKMQVGSISVYNTGPSSAIKGLNLRVRLQVLGSAVLLGLALSSVAQTSSAAEPMQCHVGPAKKNIGGSQWLIYSCADQRSVVLISVPGSPAFPFYFMFLAEDCCYRLIGEGTGSKSSTAKAYNVLQRLLDPEIRELLIEARQAARK